MLPQSSPVMRPRTSAKCRFSSVSMSASLLSMLVVAVASLITATGCLKAKPAPPRAAVFLLFDISGSTSAREVRQLYIRESNKIADALSGGEIVMGDVITHNTLATATIRINVQAPSYNAWKGNPLQFKKSLSVAKSTLRQQVASLVSTVSPEKRTDLMNAFQLADKILNGEKCGQAGVRALILFSDMIEQSGRYDFSSDDLGDKRIAEIINSERGASRLPELRGVRVWVVGAGMSPRHGLDPDRINRIQSFWLQYFSACGADLPKSHYAPALIDFDLGTTSPSTRR